MTATRQESLKVGSQSRPLSDVRYQAEWISKQHHDENGEWLPDSDEYTGSTHADLESAKRAALKGSKTANVVEWCRVTEERFDPSLRIPRRSDAAWDTSRVWHGDWEGNWEEDRWL